MGKEKMAVALTLATLKRQNFLRFWRPNSEKSTRFQWARLPLLGTLLISGCSIHQRVEPVPHLEIREVCIIENPEVKATFIDSYRKALHAKGLKTTTLAPLAGLDDCPFLSTYTANWRWDLALYMAFAEIKIYSNGKQIGHALYDSLGGGGNMGKFISADLKIQELVGQLFPDTKLEQQPIQ